MASRRGAGFPGQVTGDSRTGLLHGRLFVLRPELRRVRSTRPCRRLRWTVEMPGATMKFRVVEEKDCRESCFDSDPVIPNKMAGNNFF